MSDHRPHAAIQSTLDNPATSDWLKEAILTLLERDLLDAATDSARLAALFAALHHTNRMSK